MTKHRTPAAISDRLKPPITLNPRDHERLSTLARAAANTMPDVATVLTDELDRARVLGDGRHPDNIVRMSSQVEFRDDETGKVQSVTLVYPEDADISKGRISVLTPIGAALIGLSAGHSITWETRTGEIKRLTVLEVREPQLA